MESYFTIRLLRDHGDLHINLKGDFDDSSAKLLFKVLKRNCDDKHKIFVHTSGLMRIYPLAKQLLQNSLHRLKGKLAKIVFQGKNKEAFMT